MVWNNPDGLRVRFGTELAITAKSGTPEDNHGGTRKMIAIIDSQNAEFPLFGASDVFLSEPTAAIPSGAIIRSATLIALTGFTSGGAPTLDIGLAEQDGTEIDHDGLFAAIALSAFNADAEEVAGAGALINTKLAETGYLTINVGTANYTAGKALLEIEYIIPQA